MAGGWARRSQLSLPAPGSTAAGTEQFFAELRLGSFIGPGACHPSSLLPWHVVRVPSCAIALPSCAIPDRPTSGDVQENDFCKRQCQCVMNQCVAFPYAFIFLFL